MSKPPPVPPVVPLPSQSSVPQPPAPPPVDEGKSFLSRFLSIRTVKLIVGLLVVLIVGFLAISLISSLGGKKDKNVTLTYWGLWEDPAVMQPVLADFERENPNIKVDYSKQDVKEYRERLSSRIANGAGPDIFRFHNTWYPMLKEDLSPLPESVIRKEEFLDNFYPVAEADLVKNGAIYGIPLHIDTLALFVNRDMFQAAGVNPPASWEEFRDYALELTVKDEEGNIKTAGAAMGTFENVTHSPDILSLLFIQNGVDVYGLKPSQRLTDALNFYTSFAEGDESVWNKTLDNSILAFAKGNLAMFFGYSWDFFTLKAINPNLSFEIVPVPQLAEGEKIALASYWAEGVSSESKHQKEAFLFMKFLARKDTQEKLFTEESRTRLFGELYSNKNLSERLKDNSYVYSIVKQAPFARSSYFVDNTFDNGINAKLNTYLKDAINSILAGGSAESASETLVNGFNQVVSQYESQTK